MSLASIRSKFANGLVTSGENSWILGRTESWVGSSKPPPLLLCHGSGGNAESITMEPYSVSIANELAQYFTVFVGDFAGEAWGNDSAIAAMEAARLYLANTMGSTGLLTLVGVSMGGCSVLNYTRAYPANVKAVSAIIPAVDLFDMIVNRPGYSAPINAAYPAGNAAITAHSPTSFASTMDQNIPICLFSAPNDAICVPSTHDAFIAARPKTRKVVLDPAGHSALSLGNATPAAVKWARVQQI